MTFHVDSEVGQLKQAIVHRPGIELARLTPENVDELLFDDVMWAHRARQEHDAFVAQLESQGVVVHHFAHLLAEALDEPGAREFVQDRLTTATRFGPALDKPLDDLVASAPAGLLADLLIGGVLKSDVDGQLREPSLLMDYLRADDFLLSPAAEPPVPAGQLRVGLRRSLDQPDGQARPQARDDQLPGRLQLPPDVPRRRVPVPLRQRLALPRAGHDRGRRRHRHRQPRGDDRHG